jgi:hypothetical protein
MKPYEGKSEVKIGHLIRVVIPQQYHFKPQIASLIELIANSLDANPSVIEINFDRNKGLLEVGDNGSGMDESDFKEYHNIAATTKGKGDAIGFAGQGAKLALNFCSKVVTETWSKSYRGYSEWQLKGDDAPYRIYHNKGLGLNHLGTKVTLYLDDESRNFYTQELIEQILKEHYFPLLDDMLLKSYTGESPVLGDEESTSLKIYRPRYKKGLKFFVNGEAIAEQPIQDMLESQKKISVTAYGKPKARGFFGLAKDGLPEVLQGVAICTYGKVIERTWFKKEPREKQKIGGCIEAPYLIKDGAVTTDKCGFQRGNKSWEGLFRKAQTEFAKWLEEIGLSQRLLERKADFSGLEREINSILKNLPELTFFGARTQRDVAIRDEKGEPRELGDGTQKVNGTKGGGTEGGGVSVHPGAELGRAPTGKLGSGTTATNHQRTIRGGVRISTDERPDLKEEAWFDGETVFINKLHPAYSKAERRGFLDYHFVKSIALSLIKFNLDKDPEPSYQKAFELSQRFFRLWGEQ